MSGRSTSRTRLRSTKGKGEKKDVEEEKITLPQIAWKIIDESTTKELGSMKDVDDVAKKLSEVLSLSECKTSMKEAAQLDFFVAGYWFASRECKFTAEQVSSFITILHTLLDNLKTKHMSLGDNMKELQSMLCGVACPGVPSSVECFTAKVTVTTLMYIKSTLFQHYILFDYLFTEEQEEEVISTKLNVEIPNMDEAIAQLFPFPLEESIPQDLHQRCLAPKSSSPKPIPPSDSCPPRIESEEMQELATNTASEIVPSQEGEATDSNELDDETKEDEKVVKEQLQMSIADVKTVMETMATAALQSFQVKMMEKINTKEKELDKKLSRLEKLFNI